MERFHADKHPAFCGLLLGWNGMKTCLGRRFGPRMGIFLAEVRSIGIKPVKSPAGSGVFQATFWYERHLK